MQVLEKHDFKYLKYLLLLRCRYLGQCQLCALSVQQMWRRVSQSRLLWFTTLGLLPQAPTSNFTTRWGEKEFFTVCVQQLFCLSQPNLICHLLLMCSWRHAWLRCFPSAVRWTGRPVWEVASSTPAAGWKALDTRLWSTVPQPLRLMWCWCWTMRGSTMNSNETSLTLSGWCSYPSQEEWWSAPRIAVGMLGMRRSVNTSTASVECPSTRFPLKYVSRTSASTRSGRHPFRTRVCHWECLRMTHS